MDLKEIYMNVRKFISPKVENICMYVCMYAYMHACMHEGIYVYMYVPYACTGMVENRKWTDGRRQQAYKRTIGTFPPNPY